MVESTQKFRHSEMDQECLIDKFSEWNRNRSQDKIYFRAKMEKDNSYDDQGMLNKNVLDIYIDLCSVILYSKYRKYEFF